MRGALPGNAAPSIDSATEAAGRGRGRGGGGPHIWVRKSQPPPAASTGK